MWLYCQAQNFRAFWIAQFVVTTDCQASSHFTRLMTKLRDGKQKLLSYNMIIPDSIGVAALQKC